MIKQLTSHAVIAAAMLSGVFALQVSHAAPGDRPGVGVGPAPSRERMPAPFAGRISRVDVTRGVVTLDDVIEGGVPVTVGTTATDRVLRGGPARPGPARTARGGAGDTGTTRDPDTGKGTTTGTSGTVTGKGTTTGTSGTGSAGTGAGAVTGSGRSMTFSIAERVSITLDGKPVKLTDLKVGQHVRMHTGMPSWVTRQGDGPGSGLGADARDPRGVTGNFPRRSDGRGGIGRTTSVWKIEAYSPSPRASDTGR